MRLTERLPAWVAIPDSIAVRVIELNEQERIIYRLLKEGITLVGETRSSKEFDQDKSTNIQVQVSGLLQGYPKDARFRQYFDVLLETIREREKLILCYGFHSWEIS